MSSFFVTDLKKFINEEVTVDIGEGEHHRFADIKQARRVGRKFRRKFHFLFADNGNRQAILEGAQQHECAVENIQDMVKQMEYYVPCSCKTVRMDNGDRRKIHASKKCHVRTSVRTTLDHRMFAIIKNLLNTFPEILLLRLVTSTVDTVVVQHWIADDVLLCKI